MSTYQNIQLKVVQLCTTFTFFDSAPEPKNKMQQQTHSTDNQEMSIESVWAVDSGLGELYWLIFVMLVCLCLYTSISLIIKTGRSEWSWLHTHTYTHTNTRTMCCICAKLRSLILHPVLSVYHTSPLLQLLQQSICCRKGTPSISPDHPDDIVAPANLPQRQHSLKT